MADVESKETLDVLILGMGTGTFATQCGYYFDNLNVEGVEIDGKITDLARTYFELPESVPVTTYDGRAYLNAVDRTYDVIMVDAYQDITIPFQMSSVEFFTLVKEHLNEGGVMVVNMNMRGSSEGNINEYLADTISCVFDQVYTADVTGTTNRELFASDDAQIIDTFTENTKKLPDANLAAMMEKVGEGLTAYEPGDYCMTDDKAPVELLGMRVIDELIQDEVSYYKGIYDENGIQGILQLLQ
jgi:spermidine synthase